VQAQVWTLIGLLVVHNLGCFFFLARKIDAAIERIDASIARDAAVSDRND
jgi:hypothetical protein